MKMSIKTLFISAICCFWFFHDSVAQEPESSSLYQELKKMDEIIFDHGFNNCDLQALEKTIHSDFEFYHDENGMQNRIQFFEGFKSSICASPERKPIRKLVEGSLEVYKLKNNGEVYGAIQKGVHEFYIKEKGKELYITNVAKFTSLWILHNGEWKLKRVLSYDHQMP